MEYSFHQFNAYAKEGIARALGELTKGERVAPVIVCVGSDLVIGDCLAPLVGTMLREQRAPAFVYGTLRSTVTAKELPLVNPFLRRLNPEGKRIVVDAAIGDRSELGLVKIKDEPLSPGSGVNKRLPALGDISILGIVAERSVFGHSLGDLTRLKLVYQMARTISRGICSMLNRMQSSFAA